MLQIFILFLSVTSFVCAAPADTHEHHHHGAHEHHHHDDGAASAGAHEHHHHDDSAGLAGAHEHHHHGNKVDKIFWKISDAVRTLNSDLLGVMHEGHENENIFISPFNVYATLAQTHLGAAGTTRYELADVLKIPKDEKHANLSEIHDYIGKYIKHVTHTDDDTTSVPTIVNAANGLFVDKTLSIKSTYSEQMKSAYDSEVNSVNFGDASAAKELINKWASDKTKGRIPQVLSADLDSATRLVLASALYFSAKWKDTFPVGSTKTEKFNTGITEIDVQMMNNKKYIPYYCNPSLQFEAIQLEYLGNDYALTIIMPHLPQTLANLTKYLTSAEMHRVFNESKEEKVDYKIPKTKFANQRSLAQPLSKFGLKGIFENADLSNMVVGNVPLAVSDILHATEIEIDEEGTKASAITYIQMVTYSLEEPITDGRQFYVNRPFMLTLHHRQTCAILFSGFIHNPTS